MSRSLQAAPAAPTPAIVAERPPRREKVKGTQQMSVYLPVPAYEQLRRLAFDEHGKMHDYLIQGLDLVFGQKGLPSIGELVAKDDA